MKWFPLKYLHMYIRTVGRLERFIKTEARLDSQDNYSKKEYYYKMSQSELRSSQGVLT